MMGNMAQLNAPPVIAYDTGQIQKYLNGSPGEGVGIAGFYTIMDKAVRDQKKAEKKDQVFKDRYGQVLKVLGAEANPSISYDSPGTSPGYMGMKGKHSGERKEESFYEDLTEHGIIDYKV
ncbi:MAG: hypothetical protein K6B28_08215 [Lachnospiraceae bacterium]|nr:hypothetical protein [Lachnospiraceae bacterium]